MVVIRDGEILQDGDPRLNASYQEQRAGPSQPGPSTSSPQGSADGGRPTFDFSAAPVRLHREPPQQSLFGLPGLDFFGAHFRSRHLAMLFGATVALGFKGFLAGVGVWIIYKLNTGGHAPAGSSHPAAAQSQGPDVAQRIQNLFSNPPAGTRPYQPGSLNAQGAQQHPSAGGTGSAPARGWEARGQGQKLGNA
ncbi:hypothetical protein WJX73_009363 [Symbiochloris irregularis]|uniref:Uncharacterized protein n=1 Tax=Symbiochloris irregularis TaxID=706552 RepID=A0AAW1NNX1_9CHLO